MFNVVTVKKTLFNETLLWANRVQTAGGSFEANSVAIANNLVRRIKNASFGAKVVYLLPLLGRGIGAARVPLIDVLNVGAATNTAFVDGDFSQSTGLQGNGSSKYLDTLIKLTQIGTSSNAGLGYWENNISFGANNEPIGCYDNSDSNRYCIDLRNTPFRVMRYGNPSNFAGDSVTPINAHYYAQRVSATNRTLYVNAISIGTNATNDSASGAGDKTIYIVGVHNSLAQAWPGRCAVAYLTDGSLTDPEIADFDTTLRNYLLGPTGKPQ